MKCKKEIKTSFTSPKLFDYFVDCLVVGCLVFHSMVIVHLLVIVLLRISAGRGGGSWLSRYFK